MTLSVAPVSKKASMVCPIGPLAANRAEVGTEVRTHWKLSSLVNEATHTELHKVYRGLISFTTIRMSPPRGRGSRQSRLVSFLFPLATFLITLHQISQTTRVKIIRKIIKCCWSWYQLSDTWPVPPRGWEVSAHRDLEPATLKQHLTRGLLQETDHFLLSHRQNYR